MFSKFRLKFNQSLKHFSLLITLQSFYESKTLQYMRIFFCGESKKMKNFTTPISFDINAYLGRDIF